MHNPYIAILAAAVAAWVFGAIWYTALGKRWMMAQGISEAECERRRAQRQMPLKPLIATFVSELVMAVVLSFLLPGLGVAELSTALITGLVLGIGFIATSILVNNMFQSRSLMLTLIDSLHWIIVLVIECAVLELLS